MDKQFIIAIDGPAGAGKSTVARALAQRLHYNYLDTGALYRAMAWKMLEEKIDIDRVDQVERCCESLDIQLSLNGSLNEVAVNGVDATPFLKLPEVTMASVVTSAIPCVRRKLLVIQRAIGENGGIVAEGRDIGTVVFPEAELKFFLDADVAVRGNRRSYELKIAGVDSDPETTAHTLAERDRKDSRRKHSPLKPATDAILIDSTFLNAKEVVEFILRNIPSRLVSQ